MQVGKMIADEIKYNIGSKILRELEKKPIENSLLIFDMTLEKPDRVEVFVEDYKNFLIFWKGFNTPDALIRAESEEKVEKLLKLIEDIDCTFLVPQELAGPIERKYPNMKKENFLFFTLPDKESFNCIINHKVEKLEPRPEHIEQISREWSYSNDSSFILEKMSQYPFFGIEKGKELVSYAGTFAQTDKVSFLGFAHTKEEYRGQGMQKSVSSALVKEVLKQGTFPAMYITENNIPSIRVAEKLGFYCKTTHVRFFNP